MRRRFTVSQALDHIIADIEAEDTQQHSDTDEQVSEEEDDVEYQPEDRVMRRSPVLKLLRLLLELRTS